MTYVFRVLTCFILVNLVIINAQDLYLSYGNEEGDDIMTGTDDGCSSAVQSPFAVPFNQTRFRTIYVCANGLVCFNRSYHSYTIPENRQYRHDLVGIYCLAPYFRDLDLRSSGSVWYQTYTMSSDAENIREAMKNLVNETYSIQITPSFIFKATWKEVPLFGGPSYETVTFQVIYVTDGEVAYSFFFYEGGSMKSVSNSQFIGLLVNGYADGLDDSSACLEGIYGYNCTETCNCDNDNTVSCDIIIGTCNCSKGWSGVRCQEDMNECETNTCPDNSKCVNYTEGSFYCKCDEGYFPTSDGTCQGKVHIIEA
ncbi:sushi, nidogen and EGF-like domain-containing protein 1 isoform X2 [Ruditapes philippinarum]|uniref:sushi, nidogen and EGF-like domain-containing protein 1 isoform X2 n=1 Tax=Ruditapes philippinarum TaxID=129788 RepID=UPI00295ABECC|nr:sushi, nidogen and EGF-like domain-containing protein 1 isoform X2 [Ruditapes philippinarum]